MQAPWPPFKTAMTPQQAREPKPGARKSGTARKSIQAARQSGGLDAAPWAQYGMYLYVCILGCCFIYTLLYTTRALVSDYTPVPVWDYWRTVQYLDQLLSFNPKHFWLQHNEHRIIFSEIVFALDYLLFRGQELLPIACSLACQVGQVLILWGVLKRATEMPAVFRLVLGAAIGVLMASAIQVQVLLNTFLLQWYMSQMAVALSILTLWWSARTERPMSRFWSIVSIGAAVVATYTSGNGMLLWPLLVMMGILLRLPKQRTIAFVGAGVLSIGAYFIGYSVLTPNRIQVLITHPLYAMWFVAVYLGSSASYLNYRIGGVAGLGSLLVIVGGLVSAIRRRGANELVVAGVANCLFIGAGALLAAMSRMDPGDQAVWAAKAGRYASVQLVYWAYARIWAGWLVTRMARWRRFGQHLMSCTLVVAVLVFVRQQGGLERVFAGQQGAAHEAGIALLAGIEDADVLGVLFPSKRDLLAWSITLRQKRTSIFSGGRQDWMGRTLNSVFAVGAGPDCSGSLELLSPVDGGYRAQGWVLGLRNVPAPEDIVLTNASGTIIGLGDIRAVGHPLTGSPPMRSPSERDWVGFVRTGDAPGPLQAYAIEADHATVCPLGAPLEPPHVKRIEASRIGDAIGIREWRADPSWTLNSLPSGFPFEESLSGKTIYASYSGSDDNQGMLTSAAFSVEKGGCVVLPVAHGPSVVGLSVRLMDADTGKTLETMPLSGTVGNWRYWSVEVNSRARAVRIVAEDRGRGWGQWVAVGQPHWCLPSKSNPIRLSLWRPNPQRPPGSPIVPDVDVVVDAFDHFGQPGDQPVAGDWTGSGVVRVGVFRNGTWYLDLNGNRMWDGVDGGDGIYQFGQPGDIAVVGDWNGSGTSKFGIFRKGVWVLDINGKKVFDPSDPILYFGMPSDLPVVGKWKHSGAADQIGVYRNGLWIVDSDGDGRYQGTDLQFSFGLPGDVPVISYTKRHIGVVRNGLLILDINGNNRYDSSDRTVRLGAQAKGFLIGEW